MNGSLVRSQQHLSKPQHIRSDHRNPSIAFGMVAVTATYFQLTFGSHTQFVLTS